MIARVPSPESLVHRQGKLIVGLKGKLFESESPRVRGRRLSALAIVGLISRYFTATVLERSDGWSLEFGIWNLEFGVYVIWYGGSVAFYVGVGVGEQSESNLKIEMRYQE